MLSLVRSNDAGTMGFLKTENRVCVALSRAKHGFFIVGNLDQLCASAPLWCKIRDRLEEVGSVGDSMPLQCQNHVNEVREVKCAEDILYESPDGGCRLPCSIQFQCGHSCPRICHSDGFEHVETLCQEPCPKSCERGHPCPQKCYESCPPCKELVTKELPCGHSHLINCGNNSYACNVKVEKLRKSCGHRLKLKCDLDPENLQCPTMCEMMLSCGHKCRKRCHTSDDPNHGKYKCKDPCTKKCVNNHSTCFKQCPPCPEKISRTLECGHTIDAVACGKDDIKCRVKVEKELPSCLHVNRTYCYKNPADIVCS